MKMFCFGDCIHVYSILEVLKFLLNINTEETAEDANIQIFDLTPLTEDIAEEDFEEEEELILSQLITICTKALFITGRGTCSSRRK